MAKRQQADTNGTTAVMTAPVVPSGSPARAARSPARSPADPTVTPTISWLDLYPRIPLEARHELLDLAARQGLLYASQLPVVTAAAQPAPVKDEAPAIEWLTRWFAGQVDPLEPVVSPAVAVNDDALDQGQREAVAKALATPDVCLIRGLPGTGKSRVAAQIIDQATRRGERVLLLAQHAAALDRVLIGLAASDSIVAVRCLERDEQPERLPPAARAATWAQRVQSLKTHTLERARAARDGAQRRREHARHEETLWPRLEQLAEQHQRVDGRRVANQARRLRLAEETTQWVDHAILPDASIPPQDRFALELAHAATAHRAHVAQLTTKLAAAENQRTALELARADLTRQIEDCRPLARAREKRRWWTLNWWRALHQTDVIGKLETLEKQHGELHDQLDTLLEEIARIQGRLEEAQSRFEQLRAKRREAESRRRQEQYGREDEDLAKEQERLRSQWDAACDEFENSSVRPIEFALDAVGAAQERWRRQQRDDDAGCAFADHWARCLEEMADSWATRLPACANLVAATLTGLANDEHFGEPAANKALFDRVIVEEADQFTESELSRATRRGRRAVLIGQLDGWHRDSGPTLANGSAKARALPPSCTGFQRLWRQLHCDPSRLPYVWVREQDRLCCRLRLVEPAQRQWLETERVADFADIELRILAMPRARPVLAEVVFPASMPLAKAKEYIFLEMDELPIQTRYHSMSWIEETDRIVSRLAGVAPANGVSVALEPGVREVITQDPTENGATTGWFTCQIEFERDAGWDLARAQTWIEKHLALRDLGRTAVLSVPHRMSPALAAVIGDWLFDGTYDTRTHPAAPGAVEFVAVPRLSAVKEAAAAHRNGMKRPRQGEAERPRHLPKAGAGLELDLTAPRHGDRLPAELRPLLPQRGLVNYLEAQAIVRKLETLAVPAPTGAVAVVCLYPAQATLLRHLIGRSPKLAAPGWTIEVDVPQNFRHRDFSFVMVSLTRSHDHRAVTYGDGAPALTLALTRARDRLIVFGDPGTLCRRGQWQGALDQLDEHAAEREKHVVNQLVRCLQGHSRYPQALILCEGNGS